MLVEEMGNKLDLHSVMCVLVQKISVKLLMLQLNNNVIQNKQLLHFNSPREQTMKQSKDPFEVAFEEQEESPPESPIAPDENETQTPAVIISQGDDVGTSVHPSNPSTATDAAILIGTASRIARSKEEDEEEEEENMKIELGKFSTGGDPDKMAKMQTILSQFTDEQMNRYESFRRSGFQKANMKRLLASITASSKISVPVTIVASGIAKMFVGELVETARIVMTERKDRGPIRPCHIREAYRRLKLEGKVPRRSVPRLFHSTDPEARY